MGRQKGSAFSAPTQCCSVTHLQEIKQQYFRSFYCFSYVSLILCWNLTEFLQRNLIVCMLWTFQGSLQQLKYKCFWNLDNGMAGFEFLVVRGTEAFFEYCTVPQIPGSRQWRTQICLNADCVSCVNCVLDCLEDYTSVYLQCTRCDQLKMLQWPVLGWNCVLFWLNTVTSARH